MVLNNKINLISDDFLNFAETIPDESIDLIVTDPPYHIVSGGCTNKGKGNGIFCKENASNGKLFKHNEISFSDWLPVVYRLLKKDTHCYIFCNGRNLRELQQEAEKAGFSYQNLLVWDKGNVTPNRYYMNACEFILLLKKGRSRTINNRGCSNIIRIKNMVGKKNHPTEKPSELIRILVENSSQMNDIVLDPFMGSGSTGIACINSSRKFIGTEIDKTYYEKAKELCSKAVITGGDI